MLKTLFLMKILERNIFVCQKHYFNDIRDNFYKNLTLLKLKLTYQSNITINSINSKTELLYGEVDKAEFSEVNQSQNES
jgi:hypothetical protein